MVHPSNYKSLQKVRNTIVLEKIVLKNFQMETLALRTKHRDFSSSRMTFWSAYKSIPHRWTKRIVCKMSTSCMCVSIQCALDHKWNLQIIRFHATTSFLYFIRFIQTLHASSLLRLLYTPYYTIHSTHTHRKEKYVAILYLCKLGKFLFCFLFWWSGDFIVYHRNSVLQCRCHVSLCVYTT